MSPTRAARGSHRHRHYPAGRSALGYRGAQCCRIAPAMRRAFKLAAIFVMSVLAFAQVPAKDSMVVVISLDGLPAYALDDPKLPIPTLRRLMREGAFARIPASTPP